MALAHELLPCLLHPRCAQSRVRLGWAEGGSVLDHKSFFSYERCDTEPSTCPTLAVENTGCTNDVGRTDPLLLPPTEERGMELLLGNKTARSLWEKIV